jgi:lipopolysaccharide export LptBFGC system permease protein LptF
MMGVVNTWIGQGKLSPGGGLWSIHAVMLAIAILMFYRRATLFSLSRWLARPEAKS